jgi:DNA primase
MLGVMAGRIPESFINDLLARVDIVDVIDEHVPLKKTGKNYSARCPFHDERTPSFSVSPDKQFFHCFGCGASGSAIGFLMDYLQMDFVEAVHELAARAGLAVPTESGGAAPMRSGDLNRLYALLEQVQAFYSKQLKEHEQSERAKEYLKGRGLDGRTAAAFKLGYAPPGWDNLLKALGGTPEADRDLEAAGMLVAKDGGHYDRFRDRIMFPITDHRGRIIGFGGRVLGKEEPKYLNSPETPIFHKGRELYGLFQARRANRQLERLFVVEGYMDVIALAQHGVTNAVATLGTATTRDHLERLFKVMPEVVFCFDGDEAGRKAAWRALETSLPLLTEGHYVSFLFMPAGEDPDSLVRKEGPAVFQDAGRLTTLSDFLFDTLSANVNLATLDGRAKLVDLAKPLLEPVPAGAFKQLLAQRLARLSELDFNVLAKMLGGVMPQRADTRTRKPLSTQKHAPSLVRTAIAILVHQPQLALKAGSDFELAELAKLDLPGIALLHELIELVRSRPHLNGGALLEHWRGRDEETALRKLMGRELDVPETGMEREFVDAMGRLRAQAERMAVQPAVLPPSALSESQKDEWRQRVKAGRAKPSPSSGKT